MHLEVPVSLQGRAEESPVSMPEAPWLAQKIHSRSELHYGWWIVLATMALMFVSVGVGYYGLAIFMKQFEDSYEWSSTLVGLATGSYFSIAGLTGLLVGPQIDRHGPRWFMTGGVVMLGLGIMSLGAISTPWHLFIVYSIMAVGFGATAAVSVNNILGRWFLTRRARAMSITATGVSLGGVVLSPLTTWLISSHSLALAGLLLGIAVLIVGLPVASGVLVWRPEDLLTSRDFGQPLKVDNKNLSDAVQHRVWTRRQAMRQQSFWFILVAFLFVLTAQTGYMIHQFSFLANRLGDLRSASLTMSLAAAGSIVARLIVGRFADYIDKRLFTAVLFAVQATAVLSITFTKNIFLTWVLVFVIGLTIGNVYMMQTLLVAETFGVVSLATVQGAITVVVQIAAGFGPFLVGWAKELTGSYTVPFLVTSLMSYVAAVVVCFARPIVVNCLDGRRDPL
jgi:MFS family permease